MEKNKILKQGMQKRAGLSSILSAVPVVGGAAHALIDPVEGSPRGTSLFYEGIGGGLGSLAGGIGGSLAFRDKYDRPGLPGLAGGTVLGGIGGSMLGRWLAESSEDPEVEELRKLIKELKQRQGAEGGVVVNVGPTQAQTMPAIPEEEEQDNA